MHHALGAASRLAFAISRDLVEIDEALRRRGAIVDAREICAAVSSTKGGSSATRCSDAAAYLPLTRGPLIRPAGR